MRKLLSWVGGLALLLALLAVVAGPDRRRLACLSVGLCKKADLLGPMLVSVQKQQKLVVLTARLVEPITSARDTTLLGQTVSTTRQTAIVPATVHYAIDLASLKQADLDFNEPTQTLKIRRPPVKVMELAIQWELAQTYQDGGLIPAITKVSDNLKRDNLEKAPGKFRAQAANPELMALSDKAANDALETAFRMPLIAAGFENAKVVVTP